MNINPLLRLLCMLFLLHVSIAVHADQYATDEGIESTIQSEIIMDNNLSNVFINVNAEDGIVEVDGEVGSRAQLNRVIDIVEGTSGVDAVDATDLVVNPY